MNQFEDGYDALEIHITNRRHEAELQVKEINIRFEMNNLFARERGENGYEKYLEEELINAKIELMRERQPKPVALVVPAINGDDFELPLISADDLF